MPATFSVKCPECRTRLTSPRPIPGGKLLTCPKCDVMFAAPKPPPDDVVEDVEVIDDDVEVIDDVEVVESPKRKPKRAPSRAAVVDDVEVVDDDVEVVDDKKPKPRVKAFRQKSRNTKKTIGILVGVFCGIVFLGGGAWLLFSILGGGGEEPLGYLPSNSGMVGGANVQAILASPIGTAMGPVLSSPTMPFSKVMTATGNKPMNEAFDRVVFGGDQNGITVVVKTMASIDRNKLAEAFGSSSSTSIGGQRVYRLGGGGPKAMFVPNKRIAVFSDAPDNRARFDRPVVGKQNGGVIGPNDARRQIQLQHDLGGRRPRHVEGSFISDWVRGGNAIEPRRQGICARHAECAAVLE